MLKRVFCLFVLFVNLCNQSVADIIMDLSTDTVAWSSNHPNDYEISNGVIISFQGNPITHTQILQPGCYEVYYRIDNTQNARVLCNGCEVDKVKGHRLTIDETSKLTIVLEPIELRTRFAVSGVHIKLKYNFLELIDSLNDFLNESITVDIQDINDETIRRKMSDEFSDLINELLYLQKTVVRGNVIECYEVYTKYELYKGMRGNILYRRIQAYRDALRKYVLGSTTK